VTLSWAFAVSVYQSVPVDNTPFRTVR